MKNIILFALLIAASSASAQFFSSGDFRFDSIVSGAQTMLSTPPEQPDVFYGQTGGIFWGATDVVKNTCQYFETYTPWSVVGVLEIQSCQHDWAYAEKCDVNPCQETGISDAAYYGPCGRPIHEKEGRICRKCSQVEARERTYGFKIAGVPKSEYKTLLEKIKD